MPHAPIVILARRPLPRLADFRVFFTGVAALVCLTRAKSFDVNETRLHELSLYTLRICRAVANKPLACGASDMLYLFAPLPLAWSPPDRAADRFPFPDIYDSISWSLVTLAASRGVVPLKFGRADSVSLDVEDAVIQDRWTEFTRRYIVTQVRGDLSPLSKPDDSQVSICQPYIDVLYQDLIQRAAVYGSLVEYCKARRKGFEGLKDYDQAIIEVTKLQTPIDPLNPSPQPLTKSPKSTEKCACLIFHTLVRFYMCPRTRPHSGALH